jgi:RHH-type proline utilization regulon transcriptional repressor/proline dehydrogenase/delta 1-pyrroline-5-carboxylate dehydrogenase
MLHPPSPLSGLRRAITALHEAEESACIRALIPLARLPMETESKVQYDAREWFEAMREDASRGDAIERMIHRFRLTDREGIALMTLAEALPRIPDDMTADLLIADKLRQGNWRSYLQGDENLLSRVAGFGLGLGKDMSRGGMGGLAGKIGQSALRETVRAMMKQLGQHFVLGSSIEQAIDRSQKMRHRMERYSFDMLGEAAITDADAERYFTAYKNALVMVGNSAGGEIYQPSISVKLSALHPRYEWVQKEQVLAELTPRLLELIEIAARYRIGLTVDAEEADRLELSLTVLERIFIHPVLQDYDGFGVAVQAYQKRAPAVLDWLHAMAEAQDVRITVRLVKGAYWDTEIKRAQERGLASYPVYTRKEATDIAYLACARKLLGWRGRITPQFGTHNARTALSIRAIAGNAEGYEIQRLHGMGAGLHRRMMEAGVPSCVYAPVGPHKELLAYLIRRLLENSANSSFVNQLHDPATDAAAALAEPVAAWEHHAVKHHPDIPLPARIFWPQRINASGVDTGQPDVTAAIENQLKTLRVKSFAAAPIICGRSVEGAPRWIANPAYPKHLVGTCMDTAAQKAEEAMAELAAFFSTWSRLPVKDRCLPVEKLADRLEENRDELLALLCFEGGKTIQDGLGEIREAVDYCRYYAAEARRVFAPLPLPGVSGEENRLLSQGRGVFVCISPWNFPLAIFLGQVIAALVAGNTVAAKPAEQTPLVAARAIELLLACGLPPQAIAFLPGDGAIGAALTAHPLCGGVAFTGSGETARRINRSLAEKDGPIVPLIAETGGMNAIIADASALPEQVIGDVVTSAFRSAGQRCSAARLFCVQDSVADTMLPMLKGALQELHVGDPALWATDVGPIIDPEQHNKLEIHQRRLQTEASPIGKARLGRKEGYFFAPQAWEIQNAGWLKQEIFGPILHVVRYKGSELIPLIDQINIHGYGLTGGVHSRIDSVIDTVKENLQVGNLYINRSIIGAVVGSQPFGGHGLSGTGPKAGGPHYLLRFANEQAVSTNLTAAGGNISLLTLAS